MSRWDIYTDSDRPDNGGNPYPTWKSIGDLAAALAAKAAQK